MSTIRFLNFAFAAINGSLALGFWHKTSLIGLYLVSWVVVPAIACGTPAIAVFAAGAVLIGYSFSHAAEVFARHSFFYMRLADDGGRVFETRGGAAVVSVAHDARPSTSRTATFVCTSMNSDQTASTASAPSSAGVAICPAPVTPSSPSSPSDGASELGLFDAVKGAIQFQQYRRVGIVGRGSSGGAYLLENRRSGKNVVGKLLHLDDLAAPGALERAEQEVLALTKLKQHPYLIEYITTFQVSDGIFIVMEYAPGGDLGRVIKAARQIQLDAFAQQNAPMSSSPSSRQVDSIVHGGGANYAMTAVPGSTCLQSSQIRAWLSQMASALQHVHSMNVLHRDLAPKNVLLSSAGECKLADFGLCFQLNSSQDLTRSMVGTPFYMSPELLRSQPYSFSSDVWALGVIAFELLALHRPFYPSSADTPAFDNLRANVLSGTPGTEALERLNSARHPSSLTELVSSSALLSPHPTERLNLAALLEKLEASRGDDDVIVPELPAPMSDHTARHPTTLLPWSIAQRLGFGPEQARPADGPNPTKKDVEPPPVVGPMGEDPRGSPMTQGEVPLPPTPMGRRSKRNVMLISMW